jgi:hypothetical protein
MDKGPYLRPDLSANSFGAVLETGPFPRDEWSIDLHEIPRMKWHEVEHEATRALAN